MYCLIPCVMEKEVLRQIALEFEFHRVNFKVEYILWNLDFSTIIHATIKPKCYFDMFGIECTI